MGKWLMMCSHKLFYRQGALELERLRERRRAEEEAWFRQQQLLLEAEEDRRKTLALEEARLSDQRARSDLLTMLEVLTPINPRSLRRPCSLWGCNFFI